MLLIVSFLPKDSQLSLFISPIHEQLNASHFEFISVNETNEND